jgi:hypothetical protein
VRLENCAHGNTLAGRFALRLEIRPREIGGAQIDAVEIYAAQAGPSQIASGQHGALEIHPVEDRVLELRAPEIGAAQIGVREHRRSVSVFGDARRRILGSGRLRRLIGVFADDAAPLHALARPKIGFAQIGVPQNSAVESGAARLNAAHPAAAQIRAAEGRTEEVGQRQIAILHLRADEIRAREHGRREIAPARVDRAVLLVVRVHALAAGL